LAEISTKKAEKTAAVADISADQIAFPRPAGSHHRENLCKYNKITNVRLRLSLSAHSLLWDRSVAVRIDITSEGPQTVVFIAGHLTVEAIVPLREVCDPIEGAFVLDLSSVLAADAAGINAMRTLGEKRAVVRGASPFIQMLLDEGRGDE
jgi:hypothetical protein